jgi:hypothetical protein
MDNFKGFYFDNPKDQPFYEAGAHFKYKDLYNRLLELYNKKNNKGLSKKKINLDFFLSQSKNNDDGKFCKIKGINKENSINQKLRRTRNKKRTNYSESSSIENDTNKTKKITKQKRSIDNNIYYNQIRFRILSIDTNRITYNKIFQKIHHNSINKNYLFKGRLNKRNISAINKNKEKKIMIEAKYNEKNNSVNCSYNKNILNNINNNNNCYLKFDNKYNSKMPKLKTNNGRKNNFFNICNIRYNLYDNIFLKNKIKNKLKKNKYNSFINQNSISNISKVKSDSKNKCIKSMEIFINKKNHSKKKAKCHIKSVDYSSKYLSCNYFLFLYLIYYHESPTLEHKFYKNRNVDTLLTIP